MLFADLSIIVTFQSVVHQLKKLEIFDFFTPYRYYSNGHHLQGGRNVRPRLL
jgi:hypothetical protein